MSPTPLARTETARTRRAIVRLLKQDGPRDATQLAECLRLSPMAIRLTSMRFGRSGS